MLLSRSSNFSEKTLFECPGVADSMPPDIFEISVSGLIVDTNSVVLSSSCKFASICAVVHRQQTICFIADFVEASPGRDVSMLHRAFRIDGEKNIPSL